MFNPAAVPVTRYRYRGTKIPTPGHQRPLQSDSPDRVESPLRCEAHGGFSGRARETGWQQCRHRARVRPNLLLR